MDQKRKLKEIIKTNTPQKHRWKNYKQISVNRIIYMCVCVNTIKNNISQPNRG